MNTYNKGFDIMLYAFISKGVLEQLVNCFNEAATGISS